MAVPWAMLAGMPEPISAAAVVNKPLHVTLLRSRDVVEGLRERKKRRADGDGAGQSLADIAGKETRLVAAALFKSEEEKCAVAIQWTTERHAILSSSEVRLGDRRKRVARLETLVSQKAKHVAVEIVGAALGDDIDDAAG